MVKTLKLNERLIPGGGDGTLNVAFWVRAALPKPRCLGTLNIPITPSSFRNFGKEQLGTDFGKQALRPP